MKRFNVYPLFDIEPVRGKGAYVYDKLGNQYLDFYGGHGVISIGHCHPHYTRLINEQLEKLPFYSNSVINTPQDLLAQRLGEVAKIEDYQLYMVNSGAEANEAALKIASGITGRPKVISLEKGFHGRTALAVSVTDNDKYHTAMNDLSIIERVPINDLDALANVLDDEVAAVLIEGIQGIAGIYEPTVQYLHDIRELASKNGSLLILDEVQSGYGRSGNFFAYQHADIKPDLICMAKGMGNGFPIGGVAVAGEIGPPNGLLGTTFGGNHLGCMAGIAVLDVIEKEQLIENAETMGNLLKQQLEAIDEIREIRGRGLMIGIEFVFPIKEMRRKLINQYNVFTGNASQPNTLRLLPPLSISENEVMQFMNALKKCLTQSNEKVYVS